VTAPAPCRRCGRYECPARSVVDPETGADYACKINLHQHAAPALEECRRHPAVDWYAVAGTAVQAVNLLGVDLGRLRASMEEVVRQRDEARAALDALDARAARSARRAAGLAYEEGEGPGERERWGRLQEARRELDRLKGACGVPDGRENCDGCPERAAERTT